MPSENASRREKVDSLFLGAASPRCRPRARRLRLRGRRVGQFLADLVEQRPRLAVMRAGRVVQLGAPPEVYARPANQFVASFVGQPPMNLLPCQATADRAGLAVGESLLDLPPPTGARDALVLGIRPEDLSAEPAAGRLPIEVTIERVEFAGGKFLTYARLGEARLLAELPAQLAAGSRQSLYVDLSRLHFFDSDSGKRLG